jgi:hypothetical protein
MDDKFLVRCSYFRYPDGKVVEVRSIGRRIVSIEPCPVIFACWKSLFEPSLTAHLDTMSSDGAKRAYKAMQSCAEVAGKYFFEPQCTALVKEGPKAMVVYR